MTLGLKAFLDFQEIDVATTIDRLHPLFSGSIGMNTKVGRMGKRNCLQKQGFSY